VIAGKLIYIRCLAGREAVAAGEAGAAGMIGLRSSSYLRNTDAESNPAAGYDT